MERFVKILVGIFLVFCMFVTTASAANLWWRNGLTGGGAGDLDAVTGYADGDPAIIMQDDGGTYKAYLYRYDSAPTGSPAEDPPDVIAPDDIGGDPGRWMLVEFYAKVLVVSQGASPGQMIFWEGSGGGTNYYILTIPSAIDTNETFTVGRWRPEAKTLTDAGFNIEVDETKTTFVLTIAGLTADRPGTLPPATGSGVIFGFYIADGDGDFDFQVEPDGTDTIGAGAAGHYWEATAIGSYIIVQDVASGKWSMLTQLTWTEES